MNVLFDNNGNLFPNSYVEQCINDFKHGYNQTVDRVIKKSDAELDEAVFRKNIATLFPNFKMTRKGVFKGIRMDEEGTVQDPDGVLDRCWREIGA